MKNKFFFVISFILIFLIGFYLYISLEQKKESFRTAEIRGRKFDLEVVATEETRQKGLGGRDALCSNCGMLFVFSQSGNHSFWMKDMRFNLDIIWISGGKIVYIAKNLDYKNMQPIVSDGKADKVLEINAGLADKYGFEIGDRVEIK